MGGRVGDPAAPPLELPGRRGVVVAAEDVDGDVDGAEVGEGLPVDGEVPVVVSDAGGEGVVVFTDGGECPVVLGGEDVVCGAEGDDACRGGGGCSALVGLDGGQEAVAVGGPEGQRVRSVVLDGVGG